MRVASVDVYATYRCNLRCAHCFVGPSLASGLDLDFDLLKQFLSTIARWGAREVTFLGGEPTMYPRIHDALDTVYATGLSMRLVTNGLRSFRRLIERPDVDRRLLVSFSIDGSTSAVHDVVRGVGSFKQLLPNIRLAAQLGHPTAGVLSVGRHNIGDVAQILDLCDWLGMRYVNVHYVVDRGFAKADMVPSIREWELLYERVKLHSLRLALDVRIERVFRPAATATSRCAVRDSSNLMLMPDGRVFACPLFLDLPLGHSFEWKEGALLPNRSLPNEQSISRRPALAHCPAFAHFDRAVSEVATARRRRISCVLEKTRLRGGLVVDDSAAPAR